MKKINKISLLFFLLILFNFQICAQNIAITDDAGYTANSSAMLDVKSTTKGMLVPRLTTNQRENVSIPATGLLVFDTNLQCFFYYNGTAWVNLLATSDYAGGPDASLFTVLNLEGDTIFAVYPGGVRINVDNRPEKISGSKGGFAVGGFSSKLTSGQDYLRVTNDSVRIYVDDNPSKISGSKGGFAVGGFSSKTNTGNYLHLTPKNTLVGQDAGKNIDSGLHNSFIGYQAGYNDSIGSDNIFLGYQSGFFNSEGSNNIFIGNKSGYNNNTGEYNIFIGYYSGNFNSTGTYNAFTGYQAGYSNTTGTRNSFYGYEAGYSNIGGEGEVDPSFEGSYNSFFGNLSGYENTIGRHNTFIGHLGGYNNTTGWGNTFVGSSSAFYSETGSRNTFVGASSGGGNTTGSYNSFCGSRSGANNKAGCHNVFFGANAGYYSENVSNNTYLGGFSGYYCENGERNVFIGYRAGYNEHSSDKFYIANGGTEDSTLIYGDFANHKLKLNANVGVGVSSSSYKLYVVDNLQSNDNPAIFGKHAITDYYGVGVKGEGNYIGVKGEVTSIGTNLYGGFFMSDNSKSDVSSNSYGLYGEAKGSGTGKKYGVYGKASGSGTLYAGYFDGNVHVQGDIFYSGTCTQAGKSVTKIDNPKDPENKYLVHSFVGSPDMMNIYNGNVTTDSKGFATVKMPNYFDSLNKDFRYQLTVIGSFAQAIIYKKISNNQFEIQTNKPNVEVSWQVTGIRNDPYAVKHPVNAEEEKVDNEKGFYLHPELYGQPKEKAIGYEKENENNIESKLLIE